MGKKYKAVKDKVDAARKYRIQEAIGMVKEFAYAKFDETVDLAINLGIDPKKSDQMVRGTIVLPHGRGKKVRVVVFAKGEKSKEAEEAGADHVGAEDLVEKIKAGWLDFDKAVATPDLMGMVSRLGKILGPRGLMPNPKSGTVTFDVAKAVKDIAAGKVDYKSEKGGIVHVSIGKTSFDGEKLMKNAQTVLDSVLKAKPSSSKGKYLKKVSISSTLGIGIPLDVSDITSL
ncbi:MAG: 50S ribosomal protein L1 [Thermodesulfobacteriota bacterium]